MGHRDDESSRVGLRLKSEYGEQEERTKGRGAR